MKIHILFKFKEGPWGGGNQFLKALKKELQHQNLYSESLSEADIILFNSYPFGAEYLFTEIYKLKRKYPEKIILYRVDGPISLIRNKDYLIDKIISLFNELFVDGVIFQSTWSAKKNKKLFQIANKNEIVIHNAPDKSIFYPIKKKTTKQRSKFKIVATSWSGGQNKGFEVYKYLDHHLDFSKYTFTFIGNTPSSFQFKNIKHINALPSYKLAQHLRQSDIFITASKNDPCSNSLIEALTCNLPAVVFNDGGHPELIKQGGEIFNTNKEALNQISQIATNYDNYKKLLPKYNIEEKTQQYINFSHHVTNNTQQPKKITLRAKMKFLFLYLLVYYWKGTTYLLSVKRKL